MLRVSTFCVLLLVVLAVYSLPCPPSSPLVLQSDLEATFVNCKNLVVTTSETSVSPSGLLSNVTLRFINSTFQSVNVSVDSVNLSLSFDSCNFRKGSWILFAATSHENTTLQIVDSSFNGLESSNFLTVNATSRVEAFTLEVRSFTAQNILADSLMQFYGMPFMSNAQIFLESVSLNTVATSPMPFLLLAAGHLNNTRVVARGTMFSPPAADRPLVLLAGNSTAFSFHLLCDGDEVCPITGWNAVLQVQSAVFPMTSHVQLRFRCQGDNAPFLARRLNFMMLVKDTIVKVDDSSNEEGPMLDANNVTWQNEPENVTAIYVFRNVSFVGIRKESRIRMQLTNSSFRTFGSILFLQRSTFDSQISSVDIAAAGIAVATSDQDYNGLAYNAVVHLFNVLLVPNLTIAIQEMSAATIAPAVTLLNLTTVSSVTVQLQRVVSVFPVGSNFPTTLAKYPATLGLVRTHSIVFLRDTFVNGSFSLLGQSGLHGAIGILRMFRVDVDSVLVDLRNTELSAGGSPTNRTAEGISTFCTVFMLSVPRSRWKSH